MFFDIRKKDWKQFLSADDEAGLNEFLRKLAKHKGAYKNSDDVKSAQLWCAVLELGKENLLLRKKLREIEDVFESMFEKMKRKDEERKELAKSLENF